MFHETLLVCFFQSARMTLFSAMFLLVPMETTAHREREGCPFATTSALQSSFHLHTWTSAGPPACTNHCGTILGDQEPGGRGSYRRGFVSC